MERFGFGMAGIRRGWMLVGLLLAAGLHAVAQVATTTVQDVVYRADGHPAGGTVVVSWGAFTTADGTAVSAGSTTVTIGAGGALQLALAPNAGATPMGSYYTAVFHLNDGTQEREFWVVPVAVPGGGAAKLAGIRNQVLPTSVAMQTVSKAYVDASVASAMAGTAPGNSGFVAKTGGVMSGPLSLPADPVSANQAADKNYVDASVSAAESGTIAASRLPVFGASGAGHGVGAVPDPGATAGTARFLNEAGAWTVPAGGGSGSSGFPITLGTTSLAAGSTTANLDGVALGQTTPAAGSFTSLSTGSLAATYTGTGAQIIPFLAPSLALNNQFCQAFGTAQAAYQATYYCWWNTPTPFASLETYAGYSPLRLQAASVAISGALSVNAGGAGAALGTTCAAGVALCVNGAATATSYAGPASAPTGSCASNGVWVFSQDGHASFCSGGSWVEKL